MMNSDPVAQWLKGKVAGEVAHNFVSGILILAGGIVVVLVSFGAAFALVWVASHSVAASVGALIDRPDLTVRSVFPLTGAALAVIALFLANARLRRTHSQPRSTNRTNSPAAAGSTGPPVHLLSFPGSSNRWLEDLVFTGPRLTLIGIDHVQRAKRLLSLDLGVCSKLLDALASRRKKVLLSELAAASGVAGVEWYASQLMDIRGVFFLRNEPVGYCLSRDLRREVLDLRGALTEDESEDEDNETATMAGKQVSSPVGIEQTTTLEEFEAAYRAWLRDNPEARRAARQQKDPNAEAVRTAFETFIRERGLKKPEGEGLKVEQVWEEYKPSGK